MSTVMELELVPPVDEAFAAAMRSGLVWLPELGMGFLEVTEQPYDDAYFAKYEEYAATEMGVAITDARRGLVNRHVRGLNLVDVGIGCGDFIDGFEGACGFDINPRAIEWLHARGLFLDPYEAAVHCATFWDSIEHIADAAKILRNVRRWVFCSLPIVPGDCPPRRDWKHLRRDEHCWYWTRAGFIRWMAAQGFHCVEHNTMESLLGREDIETFALRRVG